MTMLEKRLASAEKELEKLNKSLNTHKARLAKKVAKCEALNCNWSNEEWLIKRSGDSTLEQRNAYFEMCCESREVEDAEYKIRRTEEKIRGIIGKATSESEIKSEQDRISKIENKLLEFSEKTEEERIAEHESFIKKFKDDCLKDGIEILNVLDGYINGYTKTGKFFVLYINNGLTERSFHCYTLYVDHETIFTSGTFATAYGIMKK